MSDLPLPPPEGDNKESFAELYKNNNFVIPAKAGIQYY